MEKIRSLFSLEGKTALVTGGSRGLGYSIARGLACFGADVVLAARDMPRLEAAKSELEKTGRKIFCYSVDLSDTGKTAEFFEKADRDSKGIDILVNNAGINIREELCEAPGADWDKIMDVNLKSVFLLSRCFANACKRDKRSGRIINITSLAAEGAREKIGIYAASKGALKQLTKAFAVECAKYNVNVNAIGPGYFKTPMNEQLAANKEFDAWVQAKTPSGRWGNPDELVGAAVFLASDASSYVNGQTIYVDGGWLAKL